MEKGMEKSTEKTSMLNTPSTDKLAGMIELFLEHSSRINQAKPEKYWYPLSIATYGVEEILQALDSLCSFRTTMWEKTLEFEKRFAQYQGSTASVMVNSGSSADLLLTFLLTDPRTPLLSPGDEILLPIVTWPTQIWSAKMAGLKVKFVDVDPETLNIDLDSLEQAITPKTRAIFLVHLMGNPCKMDQILALAQKHNLLIIEDCCEALGSEYGGNKVGNFGVGGAYSFFFSHHMMTMEGGMIVCNDPDVAERLKILRAHGWVRNADMSKYNLQAYDIDSRYAFVDWGFNVRPTDLQAGFGLAQLEKLPAFNRQRQRFADKFFAEFQSHPFLSFPKVDPKASPSWLALPMMVSPEAPFTRKEFTLYLESEGVETRPIVAGNIARHPVAELFPEFKAAHFHGANQIHDRGLYIGLSPMFSDEMMDRLITVFRDYFLEFSS